MNLYQDQINRQLRFVQARLIMIHLMKMVLWSLCIGSLGFLALLIGVGNGWRGNQIMLILQGGGIGLVSFPFLFALWMGLRYRSRQKIALSIESVDQQLNDALLTCVDAQHNQNIGSPDSNYYTKNT